MSRFDPWTFITEPTTIAPEAYEAYLEAREAVEAAEEALWKAERELHTAQQAGAYNPPAAAEYQKALAAWKAANIRLRTL